MDRQGCACCLPASSCSKSGGRGQPCIQPPAAQLDVPPETCFAQTPPEGQHWQRVGAAPCLQPPASLACAVQGVGLEQAGHVLGSEGAVKEQQVRNRAIEEPAGCARGADGRGS